MTIPVEPKRKSALEIALDEKLENERKKAAQTPPVVLSKVEPPPDISETDLKALNARIEAESKAEGYKNFREREQALKDGEKELEAEALALGEQREKFESEQVERVKVANAKLEEAKKALDLYKTKAADADKKMEQAQKLTSEAERIIKAQTEAEKEANERQKLYETNLTEGIVVFTEIANYVSNKGYSVGRILKYDVGLIQRMQDRKVNLASIADVISADIGRINELCQVLQDKNENPKLLEYLNSNVEYLETSLKISWQPATNEELK